MLGVKQAFFRDDTAPGLFLWRETGNGHGHLVGLQRFPAHQNGIGLFSDVMKSFQIQSGSEVGGCLGAGGNLPIGTESKINHDFEPHL